MLTVPAWCEKYRIKLPTHPLGDFQNGAFHFPDHGLGVIIAAGEGWEHVSVSRRSRMPTYDDMTWVASIFWGPEDCVMQLHVPLKDHVNNHEYCLHWWRPIDQDIPRPPRWMV